MVKGDFSDPNDAGEVSHFQALATALSGTVGLGNIAGVAVAVGIGGPEATFWMILTGLLGMASKFTECTLGVKYRNEYDDGTVSGGPMYYISKGFNELGLPGGKILTVLFSVFCILWYQLVPVCLGHRRGALCLFDHDFMELLWPESLDLPLW